MPYADASKQKQAQHAWYLKKRASKSMQMPGDFRFKRNVVTWEQLNALDAATFTTWKDCVAACKDVLVTANANRIMVARLAIQAVKLKKNGTFKGQAFEEGKYNITLKAFAKDIGMNAKTLSDWVRVVTLVVDNLPADTQVVDFSAARMSIDKGRNDPADKLVERYQRLSNPKDPLRTIFYFLENLKAALTNAEQGATEHMGFSEKELALETLLKIKRLVNNPKAVRPLVGIASSKRIRRKVGKSEWVK